MSEESKLRIEPLSNSKIRISIMGASEFDFDSEGASLIVVQILEAAKEAHQRSGRPFPNFTQTPATWAGLLTSAFGLASSQFANHVSLVMQFGDTIFAVPIEKSKLRQLGEAMVALSADDSARGH